jgi:regulator of sigma E protease
LLSLISFLIVLGLLVLVHEFGHFIAAKRLGVRVEKFSIGFGPKLFSVKRGETEYLVSAVPLGGYIKMAGDEPGERLSDKPWEFLSRRPFDRFKIIAAGPLFNYILAFLIFSVIYMFGNPTLTSEVGGFVKDYPAEKQGVLLKGDKITAVDGKSVKYWEDMTEAIRSHSGGEMRLLVERQGRLIEIGITPMIRKAKDIFGNDISIAQIGIAPSQKIERIRYGFFKAVGMGFKLLMKLTYMTYKALWSVLTGKMSLKDSVSGPIGIFVLTGEFAKLGFIYLVHFIGILSASLAIFNVLPLPILDGGHIMFLIVEKIRGRPLSVKTQEAIANVGVALLVLLTAFVLYNDMMRFGIFGKAMGLFKR